MPDHIERILIDESVKLLGEKNFLLESIRTLEEKFADYKEQLRVVLEKEKQIEAALLKIKDEEMQ